MTNSTAFHSRPQGAGRGRLAAFLLIFASVPALAQSVPGAAPAVAADGEGAKSMRVDNMQKVRYAEMFLAHRDAYSVNSVTASEVTQRGKTA